MIHTVIQIKLEKKKWDSEEDRYRTVYIPLSDKHTSMHDVIDQIFKKPRKGETPPSVYFPYDGDEAAIWACGLEVSWKENLPVQEIYKKDIIIDQHIADMEGKLPPRPRPTTDVLTQRKEARKKRKADEKRAKEIIKEIHHKISDEDENILMELIAEANTELKAGEELQTNRKKRLIEILENMRALEEELEKVMRSDL